MIKTIFWDPCLSVTKWRTYHHQKTFHHLSGEQTTFHLKKNIKSNNFIWNKNCFFFLTLKVKSFKNMHFENFTNRTQHNSTRYQNQQSLPRMMRLPSPYSHKILFYLINSPEVVCQVQNHHYHFRPFAVALCTTTLSIIVSRGSTPSESSEITLHVSGAGCKLCTPKGDRARVH